MSEPDYLLNPTLESVQQAFNDWRSTRGKRARTPASLQRQAVALRHSHPASHICSALKINDTALKRWAGELSTTPPLSSATLIELPIEPVAFSATEAPSQSSYSVSIDLGNAIQLRVHGHFTLEQILSAARQHQQGSHA